jgi:hypothetical protein
LKFEKKKIATRHDGSREDTRWTQFLLQNLFKVAQINNIHHVRQSFCRFQLKEGVEQRHRSVLWTKFSEKDEWKCETGKIKNKILRKKNRRSKTN